MIVYSNTRVGRCFFSEIESCSCGEKTLRKVSHWRFIHCAGGQYAIDLCGIQPTCIYCLPYSEGFPNILHLSAIIWHECVWVHAHCAHRTTSLLMHSQGLRQDVSECRVVWENFECHAQTWNYPYSQWNSLHQWSNDNGILSACFHSGFVEYKNNIVHMSSLIVDLHALSILIVQFTCNSHFMTKAQSCSLDKEEAVWVGMEHLLLAWNWDLAGMDYDST